MIKSFFGLLLIFTFSGCVSSEMIKPDPPPTTWKVADLKTSVQIQREMPQIQKEFRAAWVATVDNIDWPSKPGLSSAQQQNELRDLLDRARMLNLNAIIFQVRPTADAFYASDLEPWSYYLTGENGRAPEPFYDPLAFAVEEAHRRGIELHAWFNPYRAYHPTASDTLSPEHLSLKMPQSVHQYGDLLWMDPGSPEATNHSLDVIMDVVERYDIDGVHLDDYFYPYSINDEKGKRVEFPDSVFYALYNDGLSLADWRRRNVDDLVLRIYSGIKEKKPWVLFGISPFGIWRPGFPEMVTGFDAYDGLYADAKKWLNEGWVDYFTPQLYWALSSKGQPYGPLLDWWIEENLKGKHIWPGNFTSRYILKDGSHWEEDEIVAQVQHTREVAGATGNVHFSMRALTPFNSPLSAALSSEVYSEKALIPTSTWLPGARPATPVGEIRHFGDHDYLAMTPADDTELRSWIVRFKENGVWKTELVPAWLHAISLEHHALAEVVVLQAVTRLGRESEPLVLLLSRLNSGLKIDEVPRW